MLERAGARVDQSLGHRDRDRMADRAVLAHHVLVLEHHAGAGAVVLVPIRRAGQVDHLVASMPLVRG